MIGLLAARFFQSVAVLAAVYVATFWMLMAVPGDPFIGEKNVPPSVRQAIRERYGFNQPKYMIFLRYTRNMFRGDLGPTILYEDQTVTDVIANALPRSVALGSLAILVALCVGVVTGTLAAMYKGRWQDALLSVGTLLGISLPLFVIASAALLWSARYFPNWLTTGWGSVGQLVLPVLTLSVFYMAYISRLTRISVLEQLHQDYVRTARAKGLMPGRVIGLHVLRNASLPVLSYLGPAAATALTGSFVVEKVFNIPGMGQNFVQACLNGDVPLVLGSVLVYTTIVLVFNFVVDISYALADPRISLA